jgi:hypothetical protein
VALLPGRASKAARFAAVQKVTEQVTRAPGHIGGTSSSAALTNGEKCREPDCSSETVRLRDAQARQTSDQDPAYSQLARRPHSDLQLVATRAPVPFRFRDTGRRT